MGSNCARAIDATHIEQIRLPLLIDVVIGLLRNAGACVQVEWSKDQSAIPRCSLWEGFDPSPGHVSVSSDRETKKRLSALIINYGLVAQQSA